MAVAEIFGYRHVENISIADGLIFTPNTTINLEPLDEGLNLDDFLISETVLIVKKISLNK